MTSRRRTRDASYRPASWRPSSGADEEGGILPRWREASRDGPAVIWHGPNGSTKQQYYRDGKFLRQDGGAVIKGRPLKEEMHAPLSIIPGDHQVGRHRQLLHHLFWLPKNAAS